MDIVLILNNSNVCRYEVTDFDAETLLEKLNAQRFAVKVGGKVLQNGMIAAVAPATCIEQNEHNVAFTINNKALYTSIPAEQLDEKLTQLETDVNKQNFIECGGIIFNRGFYQIAEVI